MYYKFKSAEKNFYLNHSNKVIDFPDFNSDLNTIFKNFFDNGKDTQLLKILFQHQVNRKLVEIGPGKGATLKYFSEKYNFNKIVGFDLIFSDEVQGNNKYENVELLEGNFNYEIPVENNSVDCLILMMVIEHLFDPFHSLNRLKDF